MHWVVVFAIGVQCKRAVIGLWCCAPNNAMARAGATVMPIALAMIVVAYGILVMLCGAR